MKTVGSLKEELSSALIAGDHQAIDAQAVELIDTCGVQLLISLQLTALDQGCPLPIENPSEVLMAKLSAIGCQGLVQLVEVKA